MAVRETVFLSVLLSLLLAAGTAPAAEPEPSLPLPRFASLRADPVNLRTGPGERYPIEWILKRKDMPVEILSQLEHWRRVRDWQGTEGWVNERMLIGRRDVIVQGTTRMLHRSADVGSAVVARAEPGAIARLLECQGAWCRIEAADIGGWVQRSDVWGVYPNETVP